MTYSRSQPQWWRKSPGVVGGSDPGRGWGDVAWAGFPPHVWVFTQKVPAVGEAKSRPPELDPHPGLRVPALHAPRGCRARAGKLCL